MKCRWCGESIETETRVTRIVPEEWWGPQRVVLLSDGSPRAFLDVISDAIEQAGYPITDRRFADLMLCFESRGISWLSWSGDSTTVMVTSLTEGGSRATFTSKGKPSGLIRLQLMADANRWVTRLVPGFGSLWKGDPAYLNPRG